MWVCVCFHYLANVQLCLKVEGTTEPFDGHEQNIHTLSISAGD